VRRNGKVSTETVHLISSQPLETLTAEGLQSLKRDYWGIESALHYRLDEVLDEDRSRVRKPKSAHVLGMFRRLAVSIAIPWLEKKRQTRKRASTRDFHEGAGQKSYSDYLRKAEPYFFGCEMSSVIDTGAMPKSTPSDDRRAILQQMAELQSMERGTLSEEYRERPDGSGGTVRLGPYFKHQVWEGGSNTSRRVPVEEVPQLRQDIENHQRFAELADSYAHLTIEQTRARRSQVKMGADPDAKKNSRRKSAPKASAKPKPSSA
jgi:hypothetical protein